MGQRSEPKIYQCRKDHGMIIRIVRGLPACIIAETAEVVHHGIGCCGFRYSDNKDRPLAP